MPVQYTALCTHNLAHTNVSDSRRVVIRKEDEYLIISKYAKSILSNLSEISVIKSCDCVKNVKHRSLPLFHELIHCSKSVIVKE